MVTNGTNRKGGEFQKHKTQVLKEVNALLRSRTKTKEGKLQAKRKADAELALRLAQLSRSVIFHEVGLKSPKNTKMTTMCVLHIIT